MNKIKIINTKIVAIVIACLLAVLTILVVLPDYGFGLSRFTNPFTSSNIVTNPSETSSEVCDEGVVLLKNDSYTNPSTGQTATSLPLSDFKVNVFGVGACDNGWYYQGNGSGAGSSAHRVPLYQAFRETGFEINEELADAYNNSGVSNQVAVTEDPKVNYTLNWTTDDFLNAERLSQAKNFSDTAVFVLSRYGGEGNDLPKFQRKSIGNPIAGDIRWDPSRIYNQLSAEEEADLVKVCQNFNNVCVIFNCCSPMQMGFLDQYSSINSAIYSPMGGSWGAYSIPKIMSGIVNPSGHLTDAIAYDFKTAPTFANISYEYTGENSFEDRYTHQRFTDHLGDYIHYTCYEENIYEGYYWYETADAEGYWASHNLNYNQVVQFPFGYGKSFTEFRWSNARYLVNGSSGITKLSANDKIDAYADVTNTGSVAGKDVSQLYVEKPYTKGGIEKPAVQLVTFAKTEILEPGQTQTLHMQFDLQDIADYDCYDKNANGHMGYELDGGNYTFSLRTDSHVCKDASLLNKTFNIADSVIIYDKDKITGTSVGNLFTTYTAPSGASSVNTDKHPIDGRCGSIDGSDLNGSGINAVYLTRENFETTFPKTSLAQPLLGDDFEKTWKVTTYHAWDEGDIPLPQQDQPVTKTLDDVKGLSYEDSAWDEVMNSLSYDEMREESRAVGGFGSPEISKINKPKTDDKDGPCGFGGPIGDSKISASNFPSCSMIGSTWNYKMSQAVGSALGYEAINKLGGIDGNYGPGMDIHRSPLGGRNFEYYSEDPVLSGTLCSWQVNGALHQGMYCYVKHVALNDSDAGRNGRYNFATEQAFRQIYAKAFEIICKGATVIDDEDNVIKAERANAMMASVDRIGTTRVTGSYNFLTQVIRNEWGFRGSIITDYYQAGDVNDIDEGVRAGNDLMLNGANNCIHDPDSKTAKYYFRQACKNILYTYINTQAIKEGK